MSRALWHKGRPVEAEGSLLGEGRAVASVPAATTLSFCSQAHTAQVAMDGATIGDGGKPIAVQVLSIASYHPQCPAGQTLRTARTQDCVLLCAGPIRMPLARTQPEHTRHTQPLTSGLPAGDRSAATRRTGAPRGGPAAARAAGGPARGAAPPAAAAATATRRRAGTETLGTLALPASPRARCATPRPAATAARSMAAGGPTVGCRWWCMRGGACAIRWPTFKCGQRVITGCKP